MNKIKGKDWISIVDDYIRWYIKYEEMINLQTQLEEKKLGGNKSHEYQYYHYREQFERTSEFFTVAEREYEYCLRCIPPKDKYDLYKPINHLTQEIEKINSRLSTLNKRLGLRSYFRPSTPAIDTGFKPGDNSDGILQELITEIEYEIAILNRKLDLTKYVLKRLNDTKENLEEKDKEYFESLARNRGQ